MNSEIESINSRPNIETSSKTDLDDNGLNYINDLLMTRFLLFDVEYHHFNPLSIMYNNYRGDNHDRIG